MKEKIKNILVENQRVVLSLTSAEKLEQIESAANCMIAALRAGGKIIVFGNGGSAADSQHMAAELVGRFKKERKGIPAIALTTNTSTLTALSNDYGYDKSFERQVEAFGKKGDVAIGISTSGNAENVVNAVRLAKKMGLKTIALTGKGGGKLKTESELSMVVDSNDTARIQEAHIAIIHILCEFIEDSVK